MPHHHLSDAEQQQFDTLFTQLAQLLAANFTAARDQFMIAPLRYTQHALFPNNAMTRLSVCGAVERALAALNIPINHSRSGKGVYLRDVYIAGDFRIEVANARRGGKMIAFSHTLDT